LSTRRVTAILAVAAVMWVFPPTDARPDAKRALPNSAEAAAPRDGSHDFDFDFGTWKTHSSRLLHPLTGANDWVEMDGFTVVSKIWGGKANIAEYKADGPAGHIELMGLRIYSPISHQWSLNFATPMWGRSVSPASATSKVGAGNFTIRNRLTGERCSCAFPSGASPTIQPGRSRHSLATAERAGK
jgi:hypothetical protein